MNDLSYKRHLPHWRLDDSTYFVTWRLHRNQHELLPEERDLVSESLMYFQNVRYEMLGYVIMNDHVHLIVTPKPEWKLERIVYTWKNLTSKHIVSRFQRSAPVWLGEYYDHIIRNQDDFDEKMGYILTNPQRRWPEVTEYKWIWAWFEFDSQIVGLSGPTYAI